TVFPFTGSEPVFRLLPYRDHRHPAAALARSPSGASRGCEMATPLFARIAEPDRFRDHRLGCSLHLECVVRDEFTASGLRWRVDSLLVARLLRARTRHEEPLRMALQRTFLQ